MLLSDNTQYVGITGHFHWNRHNPQITQIDPQITQITQKETNKGEALYVICVICVICGSM